MGGQQCTGEGNHLTRDDVLAIYMEAFRLLRLQSLERLASLEHEGFVEAAIGVWECAADQIIALVGEAGFDSLYARTVFLAMPTFPWLLEPPESPPAGYRFANLRANLEGKPQKLAQDVNALLLTIFTDTLASLIGEPVTEHILKSAWGHFAPVKLTTGN